MGTRADEALSGWWSLFWRVLTRIMSRSKEFLVDGSTEELCRRKVKAIRQCIKILEEEFLEPNKRISDSCHMSKARTVKALHADVENEDTDFFCFSSTETKTNFKLGLCDGNSQGLARPFSHNAEEKNVQHLVSSDDGLRVKPVQTLPADMDSKTMEDIDEALCIAICNLSHLHDADEMLKYLKLKVKQEGDRVAETADRMFDDLTTSLFSRRKKFCADLVKSINNYSSDIAEAKKVIEEKRKCLTGVIRIAKELIITPSLRTCCDLAQVIYNLTLPVEAELSRVNSLSEVVSTRFFVNTNEFISLLKHLGKIEWATTEQLDYINSFPNKCFPKYSEDNGQQTAVLDDEEEMPGCDTQSSVENRYPALSRESKVKAFENKLDIHKRVENAPEETLPMIHRESMAVLPESPSSPDVIIEEIFEDDLEGKFLNT